MFSKQVVTDPGCVANCRVREMVTDLGTHLVKG